MRSLIRMLGTVFAKMDEAGQQRDALVEDLIVQAEDPKRFHAPAPTYEGSAEDHARRIMDFVMASYPVRRKAEIHLMDETGGKLSHIAE